MSRRYIELLPTTQTAISANGNSGAVTTSASDDVQDDLVVYLDVTVASASDTLDVVVKGVVNGKTYVLTGGTFTQATAVSTERIVITDAPKDVQLEWTVGGTAISFDFNIRAHRSG